MKRKIAAISIIAAMLLSGCQEVQDTSADVSETSNSESTTNSINSADLSTAAQSTKTPEQSESGGAPTVIAPNFKSSVPEKESVPEVEDSVPQVEESVPDSSDVSFENSKPSSLPVNNTVVENGETRTVASGETLEIAEGESLEVEGELIVESGAVLNVLNGGELFVESNVKLEGDIVLSEGGKLTMTHDTAKIEGAGSVVVKKDFEQVNCERGFINVHIAPPERVVGEDGATYVGGIVIANKAITLPPEYGSDLSLDEVYPEVSAALDEMNAASEHQYVNKSGYRSYYDQQAIFQNYCDMYGYDEADTFSSQAGHSEHQTGLTMDLDAFEESYGDTPEGIWLADNCWKYGFIIRYPKGKEDITGYTYEPWHVRYLGKSTAKLVFYSGLTLEEFLDVEGGTTVID